MSPGLNAYADLRKKVMARLVGSEKGNPQATVEAVLQVVDAEAPPLRVILGDRMLPMVRAAYADRLVAWKRGGETVSNSAQGESR